MSRNIEIVTRALEAFSRGDAETFVELSTEDLEWTTGLGAVEGEVFHGHDGVRTYFARLDSAWDSFRFLADEYRDFGETVVVLGGRRSGAWWRRPRRLARRRGLGPARGKDLAPARVPRSRQGAGGGPR